MADFSLAAEYDNRARVPEHPAIIDGWNHDAEAFRRSASKAEYDLVYGRAPRNRLDLFKTEAAPRAPVIVFIHGGYWRTFDKSYFSHLARGALMQGFDVAVPSYSLCPSVTLPAIIAELRVCCLFLWRKFGRRLVVVGHSAGGHLAACMAATPWQDHGAPTDLVTAGMSVSGVFDLRPLLVLPVNDDLRLDAADAMLASPLLWPMPQQLAFDLWVGGEETSEFHRQSRSLSVAWSGLGLEAQVVEVPGANHFTIPSQLADPASPMTLRLAELAGR
ncbi:MAG: alpha/beta hydrolase [Rhizobiales bacterium]|nr:alpha/beta hydrolase [Hyphomicrobiales bacterium]MBI3674127.1 alpha/beta hydrolase [Hyphomicrobiales bacterium]